MSNTHSTHSKVRRVDTNPPTAAWQPISRALGGSPPIDCPPWVACGQPHSRVSEWALANIHQEQLKSHSGILPRVTAPSRSVGRLSAGHHRLILPLCELRLTHRFNTAHTAPTSLQQQGQNQYTATWTAWNYSYGCYLCWNPPVGNV